MTASTPLPTGWSLVALQDLCTDGPTNGYSGPTSSDATGTPTLRLSATTSGSMVLDSSTVKRLNETIEDDSPLWLQPGDLLVQRSNTLDLVGTAAVYAGPPRTYVYPDLMMRVRFGHPETAAWVRRFMNSPRNRQFFTKMAAGSSGSMPKISGAKLRQMHIPLPPLPEQRRIADILDRADALRAKRRAALAHLDTLTQSIFVDVFGDGPLPPVDASSAPAERPEAWPRTLLTDAARLATGHTPDRSRWDYWNGGIPWISLTDIRDLDGAMAVGTSQEVSQLGIDNSSAVRLPPGTVCFSRTASVGFVTIMGREMATSQDFVNWVPGPMLEPVYLMWALIRSRRQLRALSTGSTHKTIYVRVVEQFRLLLPPLELQREFARRVAVVERLKVTQRASLVRLDALFASVQHGAFGGEL